MENEIFCPISTDTLAASYTAALGINKPKLAAEENEILKSFIAGKNIDRVVIYNPDAVALWLFRKYTNLFAPVMLNTQLTLPLQTVMPSVTPVCFATIYSGVQPEIHGIRAYKKPVLTVETVFDALIKAGKKPCIVSTEGDSISKIFLERNMDYFIYETVEEVNKKAFEIIKEDKYDFICIYNGNYDSNMHRVSPEGKEAMDALKENANTFESIVNLIKDNWKEHKTLIGFAPDHGCHEIDGGAGSHGLMMEEDMNVIHFYGII